MLEKSQTVTLERSKAIIKKLVAGKKTEGLIKRAKSSLSKTKLKDQKINFSDEQIKRQLLDFKPEQAPWLKQYPMIQQKVNQIIREHKKDIVEDAKSLFQEFPRSALLPYKLYIEELKQFKPNDQDIVSLRMVIYTYTGGAHGIRNYYSWNWSKQKKRFLSLDEIITSEQFAALVKHTRQILFERQKQGDKYDKHRKINIQRGVSKKEDFKVWNFNRNGIVFIFPEYQVASYAEGSFEVYIPLDLFQ